MIIVKITKLTTPIFINCVCLRGEVRGTTASISTPQFLGFLYIQILFFKSIHSSLKQVDRQTGKEKFNMLVLMCASSTGVAGMSFVSSMSTERTLGNSYLISFFIYLMPTFKSSVFVNN